MAVRKVNNATLKPEHIVIAIVLAALVKFSADEFALIAEHGFDNWRRHRFGW